MNKFKPHKDYLDIYRDDIKRKLVGLFCPNLSESSDVGSNFSEHKAILDWLGVDYKIILRESDLKNFEYITHLIIPDIDPFYSESYFGENECYRWTQGWHGNTNFEKILQRLSEFNGPILGSGGGARLLARMAGEKKIVYATHISGGTNTNEGWAYRELWDRNTMWKMRNRIPGGIYKDSVCFGYWQTNNFGKPPGAIKAMVDNGAELLKGSYYENGWQSKPRFRERIGERWWNGELYDGQVKWQTKKKTIKIRELFIPWGRSRVLTYQKSGLKTDPGHLEDLSAFHDQWRMQEFRPYLKEVFSIAQVGKKWFATCHPETVGQPQLHWAFLNLKPKIERAHFLRDLEEKNPWRLSLEIKRRKGWDDIPEINW